ncbi:MAG TPA: acyl-CoA dehydrogenase family protein [Dehalococcoidia bacterium]|nr:acyl-CoA dehydrogenase family protein [Dehalococcoidia bacterium]
MDLGLSEEQEMLREFARDFLEKECPEQHVRDMEEDERGYSPDLWRKMAEQGWSGLIIPENYGGVGMTYLDLVILIEEFGRALVPGPFISNCVATIALLEAGSEAQKQEYLPLLASGTQFWTLAFTEPSARFDADGVELRATRDGDSYVLNGTKLFIRDSHTADRMVVVARTGGAVEDGISLFVVETSASGISQSPIRTISSERQNEVKFENVRVPAANLLGDEGKAWPAFQRIANKATVLECAYLVGLTQMAFDITLNYTKERVQFGRPIASFQAMQHKAADIVTDVDGSRYITYRAAWAVAEDEDDADEQTHIAKAWVSDASRRTVAQCQQMHGGIGFTKDYKIQLYYRRQKAAELAWGDADYHRNLVGVALGI